MVCPSTTIHAYFIFTSCWSHADLMLVSCWLHADFMLISCWSHAGFMLASCWGHAGFMLASCWLHAEVMLASCWGHSGFMLASCWLHADFMLIVPITSQLNNTHTPRNQYPASSIIFNSPPHHLPGRADRYLPAPPQTRTSRFPASGSSGYGFAAYTEWKILGLAKTKVTLMSVL
jgi:hypothetical protein